MTAFHTLIDCPYFSLLLSMSKMISPFCVDLVIQSFSPFYSWDLGLWSWPKLSCPGHSLWSRHHRASCSGRGWEAGASVLHSSSSSFSGSQGQTQGTGEPKATIVKSSQFSDTEISAVPLFDSWFLSVSWWQLPGKYLILSTWKEPLSYNFHS